MNWKRLLPLSGVAFVLMVIGIVVFAGDTPESTAPGSEVAAYYDEHEAEQAVAAFVLAAAALFLVLFSAAVGAAASASGAASAVWERVQHAGSTLAAGMALLTATVHFALADAGIAPAALEALNSIDGNFWVGFNAALGVMMIGAAGVLIPLVRWYRRLGWAALVLGIALFIPIADFFALLLTGVWIVVASVLLAREPREASSLVPASAV